MGAPVSVMVSGWCSVFHQSTLNLMIGRFDHADQRQDGAGAIAALRVVERAHQRDVAEIQEEQHQHRGQPRVPHPPGAPHRLAPQAAGGQAQRGEAGADRADLHRRQVGQRMAPDQRQHRADGQADIAGGGQPGGRHMDVHDAHRVALLPVGGGEEQAPDQADRRSAAAPGTASHGSTAPDRRRNRPGLAKRCRDRPAPAGGAMAEYCVHSINLSRARRGLKANRHCLSVGTLPRPPGSRPGDDCSCLDRRHGHRPAPAALSYRSMPPMQDLPTHRLAVAGVDGPTVEADGFAAGDPPRWHP